MRKLNEAFQRPSAFDSMSNYAGEIPADAWLCLMARNRDSDTLTESNWRSALTLLGGESDTVQIFRFGHWAYGWVEYLAVQENTPQAKIAAEIEAKIEAYPVLNEDDWSELETAEADKVWANCYDTKERIVYIREHKDQFDFRSMSDLIAVVRGQYFIGYASELLS